MTEPGLQGSTDLYFQLLAAHGRRELARDRLDACMRFLRNLPPGQESLESLEGAGLLSREEAGQLAARAQEHRAGGGTGAPAERAKEDTPSAGGHPSPREAPDRKSPAAAGAQDGERIELLGDEFELLGVLGRGGMGTVYRAREIVLDRLVALKILHPQAADDPERVRRFEQEARAASRIDHPGLVRVHGVGTCAGRRYISMEFVDGVSLSSLIPSDGLSPRRAMEIARDVARALHAAHLRGVFHRDLKPGNILIERGPDGAAGGGRARLLDFGLARLDDGGTRLTRAGELMGTPAYISPEQALGMEVDARSEVFSLGATLYHALVGRPPRGEKPSQLAFQSVAHEVPRPIGEVKPDLSRDAATICSKALRWDPRDRYTTAEELADDVDRFLRGEAIRARPASVGLRCWRWAGRHRALLATATVLLLLAGTATLLWRAGQSYLRAEKLLADAESSIALGNPLPAAERARAVLESGSWKSLEPRACDVLVQALDKLGYHETLLRVHGQEAGAAESLERALPRDIPRLSEKLWSEHQLDLLPPLLHDTMTREPASRDAFLAGLYLARLDLAKGSVELALERFQTLGASPLATSQERAEIASALSALPGLGSPGSPMGLGRMRCSTIGRLRLAAPQAGGETQAAASSDLVLAALVDAGSSASASPAIRVWSLSGTELGPPRDIPLPPLPENPLRVDIMSLADIDPPGPEPGQDEILIYLACGRELVGSLHAFRVEGQNLVPAGDPVRGLGGQPTGSLRHGLTAADLTGDGSPEVVLGLASGHELGQRTVVIEHPFASGSAPSRKIHVLPPLDAREVGRNDTSAVFVADLDGDGKLEVGYSTSCWRGYDFRAYRYDPSRESFVLLAASGKIGSISDILACDLDADGRAEIVAAMSSYVAANSEVFPSPPGRGAPEGIHVYRLDTGGGTASPVFREVFRKELGDDISDPRDMLYCHHLAMAEIDGKRGILASWLREKGGRQVCFLDLLVPSAPPAAQRGYERGELSFERHRVFWTAARGVIQGDCIQGEGGTRPRLMVVVRRDKVSGTRRIDEWSLVSWSGVPLQAGAPAPPSAGSSISEGRLRSVLAACLELEQYDRALEQLPARGEIDPESMDPELRILWARVAGRARRWTLVQDILGPGEHPLPDLTGPSRAELDMLSRAAREGIALREGAGIVEDFGPSWRDRWTDECPAPGAGGGGALLIIPCPGAVRAVPERAGGPGPIRALSRKVSVKEPSGLYLRVDLEFEAWDTDQQIQVGLWRPGTKEAYGIHLIHPGARGQELPGADILWGSARDARTPTAFRIERGVAYRLELEHSPAEGRVRIVATRLGKEVGPSALVSARSVWPPETAASGVASEARAEPCPAGDYELGIFGDIHGASSLSKKDPVRLRLRTLEGRGFEPAP